MGLVHSGRMVIAVHNVHIALQGYLFCIMVSVYLFDQLVQPSSEEVTVI